jgi:ABC-2 type transport system permease protein
MNAFTGTGDLVRLNLRRDRIMLPAWLAVFVLMGAGSAAATVGLFPTVPARVQAAESFNNAQALVAFYGKVYDPTSLGALATIKLAGTGAIFVAVLAILTMVRHTRAEEETGRLELVGATVVGRQAALTAALIVTVGTNLALAVFTALGMTAAGLPLDGSVAFGLAWAGVGIAFAAVAAVTAQLTTTARAATGLAVGFLGLVYVLRAIGDTATAAGPKFLTWLSPIGWGQQFRPYAGNRWWVLLITFGFAAVVTAGAYLLVSRRDLGAGLLPDRLGRGTASPSLRSPLALAWRLQRGLLLAWVAGFAVLGSLLGNIASNVSGFVNNPAARDFFVRLGGEKALIDMYLTTMIGVVGVVASAYGVQAASRLRVEESAQRAEPVLATGITRRAWILSHTLVALVGVTLVVLVAGLAAGLAHGAQVGDMSQVGRVFTAALVQLPAAWVVTAIVVTGYGIAARFAVIGWVAFVGFVLIGELGPVFKLPQWAMDLSPFTHTPKLPGATLHTVPLVTLTLVAVALVVAGVASFRRRDAG